MRVAKISQIVNPFFRAFFRAHLEEWYFSLLIVLLVMPGPDPVSKIKRIRFD